MAIVDRALDSPSGSRSGRPLGLPSILVDGAFLGLVVLLSLMLYVRDLGFTSDDWVFLGTFGTAVDNSFPGLFRAIYVNENLQRPMEALSLVVLYQMFGLQPLGYHAAIAAVLVATSLVFFL